MIARNRPQHAAARTGKHHRLVRSAAAVTAAGLTSMAALATASGAGATVTTVDSVVNGGFESGTHGWRTNSAAEHLATTGLARTGQAAGLLTTTAVTTAVLNDAVNSVASTTAGTEYEAQAWVRTQTPTLSGELRLREVKAGALVASAVTTFKLTDTAWHLVKLAYVAGKTGSALDLNVLAWNVAPGDSLSIDDVSLVAVAAAANVPASTVPVPVPAPTTTVAPAPTTTVAPAPTTTVAPAPTTTVAPAPTTTVAPAPTTDPSPACTVSRILVSSCGIWWGATANVLGTESIDQALVNFESTTGRTLGLVHYYHRGTQLFPTGAEITRARQPGARRLLLENWKPENGSSWAEVAAGAQDAEIDAEAAYLKAHFSERFFLSVHHEPEDEVIATAGSGFTASDYRAMFRHVILRLRADGVGNAVTVADYTGSPRWGSASWFNQMYPGNDVVDWLAEDPYVVGPLGGAYDSNYSQMVDRTFAGYSFPGFYTWAGQVAGNKPIMLAEWGVDDPAANPGWKAAKFDYMAAHLGDMPRVKALVYWNSNTFPNVGTTRVDSSASSLAAYQSLGALPVLNPPVPAS